MWPKTASEPVEWRPRVVADPWPHQSESSRRSRSYVQAVPPRIASQSVVVRADVGLRAETAVRELSRFDAEVSGRFDHLAPVLLRSESAASSLIEALSASARSIFTAELLGAGAKNAMAIAAHTNALTEAVREGGSLTSDTILRMHALLMESEPAHTPGQWRREPVWIGRNGTSPVGADFVGPAWESVPELIADLVKFAQRRDVGVLVLAAISHAQFETIHPFTDGNGRTGRALVQALLKYHGVTTSVAVPVSAGVLSDVDTYFRALGEYRQGNIDPIVDVFALACLHAIDNARVLASEISEITQAWNERIRARKDSGIWALLELVARRPVVDASFVSTYLGVSLPNVYPLLDKLSSAGILRGKAEYRRGTLWRSQEILDAIDRFAARAGRRQSVPGG